MARLTVGSASIDVGVSVSVPPPTGGGAAGGEAHVRATLGIAVPGSIANFANFTQQFGREVKFYRAGGTHDAPGPNLTMLHDNFWAHYTSGGGDPRWGFHHKYPKVTSSQILPMVTGRNLPLAERAQRMRDTLAGSYDGLWDLMLKTYLGQAPKGVQHRFNVNNEPDNHDWYAYRVPQTAELNVMPISLWRDCYDYIADKVHAAGHLVVLTGNGNWHRVGGLWPANTEVWRWCLPSPESYDIFAQNCYWNDFSSKFEYDEAFRQIKLTQQIAKDLGKKFAIPEYGLNFRGSADRPRPITDTNVANKWFNDMWNWMATLPASGPGALDHHDVWNTEQWTLPAAVFSNFKARFGGP